MYPYIIARKPKRKKTYRKFVFQTPLKETSVNLQYNKKEKVKSHYCILYITRKRAVIKYTATCLTKTHKCLNTV